MIELEAEVDENIKIEIQIIGKKVSMKAFILDIKDLTEEGEVYQMVLEGCMNYKVYASDETLFEDQIKLNYFSKITKTNCLNLLSEIIKEYVIKCRQERMYVRNAIIALNQKRDNYEEELSEKTDKTESIITKTLKEIKGVKLCLK